VRVAITLDDDVAAELKAEMDQSGESFKQVVNTMLRLGLAATLPGGDKKRKGRTSRNLSKGIKRRSV
jgi:hypothetical protein